MVRGGPLLSSLGAHATCIHETPEKSWEFGVVAIILRRWRWLGPSEDCCPTQPELGTQRDLLYMRSNSVHNIVYVPWLDSKSEKPNY